METTVKVIEVPAFMEFLKENGLMIGKASDFVGKKEFDLNVHRANIVKKTAITLKEVLDAKILPVKSKHAVNYWIEQGKFKEGETYKCAKTNKTMILVSALVRLGYLKK